MPDPRSESLFIITPTPALVKYVFSFYDAFFVFFSVGVLAAQEQLLIAFISAAIYTFFIIL